MDTIINYDDLLNNILGEYLVFNCQSNVRRFELSTHQNFHFKQFIDKMLCAVFDVGVKRR